MFGVVQGTMSFQFKRKESVRQSVCRVAQERIEHAIANLGRKRNLGAIHSVRKDIKQLRALLRLIRPSIGEAAYRREIETLRAAAAELAPARDAHVKLKALAELERHFQPELHQQHLPTLRRVLRKNCQAEAGQVARHKSAAKLKGVFERVSRDLDTLPRTRKDWRAVEPGLKKSYRRGRRAWMAAARSPTPENLHEWRKRVKDLWYQLRLLRPIGPRKICAEARELEHLGECLGEDHDLSILHDTAAGLANDNGLASEAGILDRVIFVRQGQLRAKALELGECFYEEKPSRFCRRLRSYWKTWRAGKK